MLHKYTDIKTDQWCFPNFADGLRHRMINAANKYKPVTVWKTTASCILRTQDINNAEAYSWKSLFSFGRFGSHDALIGFLHDTVIGCLDLKKKKS